ncbi:hypothetical protein TWF679_010356 [Orbilia oligospora]|uniref:Uncharacterized protein n=1 Tax=Orbilia oligospora TaxID=2813651 RepID=A0A8H8VIZ9_ORBOL|nr:hypothetical protein TWF679_010356 [Orbilia oligospora]
MDPTSSRLCTCSASAQHAVNPTKLNHGEMVALLIASLVTLGVLLVFNIIALVVGLCLCMRRNGAELYKIEI